MVGSGSVVGRLADAGLSLPDPPDTLGVYLPARRVGSLVFTAGQLPLLEGALLASGVLDVEVDEATGRRCAAQAALNALAAASTVCDLDDVEAVVRLTGYVASKSGFYRQSAVIDGASEVLQAAYGERGAHARVAVGVAALPMDAPVEIEILLQMGSE
jgi:enamine deaminase RidA (YjgF/YER057c/UK114 family)